MIGKKLLPLLLLLCLALGASAQNLSQKITLEVSEAPLMEVLQQLAKDYQVPLFYQHELIEAQPAVSGTFKKEPLREVLNTLLRNTNLAWATVGGQIVLKPSTDLNDADEGWTIPNQLPGGSYTVSGHVIDELTGEALIGATIQRKDAAVGAAANEYGFFSLTLPEGNHELECRFLGFKTQLLSLALQDDKQVNITMLPNLEQLHEVLIDEQDASDPKAVATALLRMPMRQVEELPGLLGSKNILEGVQQQPGVSRKTEGASGFFVRGGNLDQNLILIDEAPVYNEAHFLGFVSVFNWNTIQHAELYKDGIPARYGGRLSSVLDLRMKEGNMVETTGSGEITPLYAQLTLEGPLKKNKSSVLLSARRSWPDLVFDAEFDEAFNIRNFSFYDLNGKSNLRLGKKDRLYLSGYIGNDVFQDTDADFMYQRWGNRTGTLRWNHIYGKKLFSNVSLVTSIYEYVSSEELADSDYYFGMGIADFTAKADFNWYPSPRNTVRFGGAITSHNFVPGAEEFSELDSAIFVEIVPSQQAREMGLYVSNNLDISPRLSLYSGLRFSAFENYGEANINSYDSLGQRIGVRYNEFGVYNREAGLEPRVQLRYKVGETGLIDASYDRMRQYLHLASNTITKAPTDIWIPSSPNVKPQISDQLSVGYLRTHKKGMYRTGVDFWYKYTRNAIDFRERASLLLNEDLEADLRQGISGSVGLEFMAQKVAGRLTGALSYTLSSVWLEVPGINNGESYWAAWDRPHDVSIQASYRFRKRWQFSANFVAASGLPTVQPVGTYTVQGQDFTLYNWKNDDRLPTYHRLDAAARLMGDKTKRWRSDWTFSIYNVYNRFNAYTIVYDDETSTRPAGSGTLYYVFPIMPSISYRFQF